MNESITDLVSLFICYYCHRQGLTKWLCLHQSGNDNEYYVRMDALNFWLQVLASVTQHVKDIAVDTESLQLCSSKCM